MKTILIIILSLFSGTLYAPGYHSIPLLIDNPANPFEKIIMAIVRIESNGNDSAYNKKENAVGAFQIREIRLKDYNQRTGSNYQLQDCYDYEVSKKIFLYYASKFHPEDIKGICVCWNGVSKENKYFNKVKSLL